MVGKHWFRLVGTGGAGLAVFMDSVYTLTLCTVPLVGIAAHSSPVAGSRAWQRIQARAQCPESKALGSTCAHVVYYRPSLTPIDITFFSIPGNSTPWAGFWTAALAGLPRGQE